MAYFLKRNIFFTIGIAAVIIIGSLTFYNLPATESPKGIQTINGVTFNFADYPSLNDEQIALYNYMSNIIMNESVNSFDNWNAKGFEGFLHYMFAFTDYALTTLFETTPGYRTDNYREPAHQLIKKMDTSMEQYGNESIEYLEWARTTFPEYYWPNPLNTLGLYMGGFRGPANIMWTGHFTLMQTYYERCFHTNEFVPAITWFINDWQNSLTTDGYGNEKNGGIWGVGMIPCEPYIVFVQCNSIAIYCTALYDNLYHTHYMDMWDYGLNFINTKLHNEYGLFVDGYYIQVPAHAKLYSRFLDYYTIPGPALNKDGRPAESSYCTSWALTFLEYVQPEKTIQDYPVFLEKYRTDVSGDQMYMSSSFNYPGSFSSPTAMLGTFFTCMLAKQRGDYNTVNRIQNFLNSRYNKVWSADGRTMYYDTSSLISFLQPVVAGFRILSTTPVTVRDLAEPRSGQFWNYPYIYKADDDNIWVYQAQWDPDKEAFILNIKVDKTADLFFKNFHHEPTAYSSGVPFAELTPFGDDYVLKLEPGTYNLIIL